MTCLHKYGRSVMRTWCRNWRRFRDAPKFEYVARRFLNLTEIDDPDPISHVDDALTALQAHGDALPSDDESSYDSEECRTRSRTRPPKTRSL